VTNMTIARQWFGKHFPAGTDKHRKQNNIGTVRHGDLYSACPEVIEEFSSFVWRRGRIPPP
jgi:hypothetical protein